MSLKLCGCCGAKGNTDNDQYADCFACSLKDTRNLEIPDSVSWVPEFPLPVPEYQASTQINIHGTGNADSFGSYRQLDFSTEKDYSDAVVNGCTLHRYDNYLNFSDSMRIYFAYPQVTACPNYFYSTGVSETSLVDEKGGWATPQDMGHVDQQYLPVYEPYQSVTWDGPIPHFSEAPESHPLTATPRGPAIGQGPPWQARLWGGRTDYLNVYPAAHARSFVDLGYNTVRKHYYFTVRVNCLRQIRLLVTNYLRNWYTEERYFTYDSRPYYTIVGSSHYQDRLYYYVRVYNNWVPVPVPRAYMSAIFYGEVSCSDYKNGTFQIPNTTPMWTQEPGSDYPYYDGELSSSFGNSSSPDPADSVAEPSYVTVNFG